MPADFNLFCYGDDHEGTVLRDNSGWNKLVAMMNEPYGDLPASRNIGVDHGDTIEAIKTDDPRYDHITQKRASITSQAAQAVRNRKSIRKQLVCILQGNHERKLHRFGDITKDLICEPLKVEYGTYACVITYQSKKGEIYFKHYCAHGWGSIRSAADDIVRQESNRRLSLKRKLRKKMDDCLLMTMGHTHQLLKLEPIHELYMTSDELGLNQSFRRPIKDEDYIHPDHRWYLNVGSFHKTYELDLSGYNEVAGYDPTLLGFYVVRVRDKTIEGIDEIRV